MSVGLSTFLGSAAVAALLVLAALMAATKAMRVGRGRSYGIAERIILRRVALSIALLTVLPSPPRPIHGAPRGKTNRCAAQSKTSKCSRNVYVSKRKQKRAQRSMKASRCTRIAKPREIWLAKSSWPEWRANERSPRRESLMRCRADPDPIKLVSNQDFAPKIVVPTSCAFTAPLSGCRCDRISSLNLDLSGHARAVPAVTFSPIGSLLSCYSRVRWNAACRSKWCIETAE
jgi:hypothetical protein